MIELGLLRHGTTEWNLAHRLQGRADTLLSEAGRRALQGRRLPAAFRAAPVYCSPLKRARETAALLGKSTPVIEPALIEMDWGHFEGCTIDELRQRLGPAMLEGENRGLDFRPPGGESPREVCGRLAAWLVTLARSQDAGRIVAITHKGIIRCLLSLAYDWDMLGRQPVKLDWAALHVMLLDPAGKLHPGPVNQPLDQS